MRETVGKKPELAEIIHFITHGCSLTSVAVILSGYSEVTPNNGQKRCLLPVGHMQEQATGSSGRHVFVNGSVHSLTPVCFSLRCLRRWLKGVGIVGMG